MRDGQLQFCVLHRADFDQWQFIAGGGEDDETPIQATKREIYEEGGITVSAILQLDSICSIPTEIFPKRREYGWREDLYVIPEYAFAFACDDLVLSHEHTECVWLSYSDAREKLHWDSNKTALVELRCRLK